MQLTVQIETDAFAAGCHAISCLNKGSSQLVFHHIMQSLSEFGSNLHPDMGIYAVSNIETLKESFQTLAKAHGINPGVDLSWKEV